MKGNRSLTPEEIKSICDYFLEEYKDGIASTGKSKAFRNYTIFMLGLFTGMRCSEYLSLKVEDVYKATKEGTKVLKEIYLKKMNTKGKKEGRTFLVNDQLKKVLEDYFNEYDLYVGEWLFPGQKSGEHLTRKAVEKVYKKAFKNIGLEGKLATHCTRKCFASACYRALGKDLVSLQQVMGHVNIDSTSKYIAFDNEKIIEVVKGLNF
jgi:integrase/recombinase XerD